MGGWWGRGTEGTGAHKRDRSPTVDRTLATSGITDLQDTPYAYLLLITDTT